MNSTSPGTRRPLLDVGLAQFKPLKADVVENLARVRDRILEAGTDHHLLVFPEAALSGYFLEGGVAEAALTAEEVAAGLGAPPAGAPDVVIGFYERWHRRLYNSAVYLTPEGDCFRVVHVHRKIFLPTYGVFDEARFVEHGREPVAFDTRWGRMGMLVCEDAWHSLPPMILALEGAELVIVVSASPARGFAPGSGRPQNLDRWDLLAPAIAVEHGIFVVVSQLVGSEGGKLFPGGSIAAGPDGTILARGPLLEEGVTEAVLDGSELDRSRAETPLLPALEQMLPHLLGSLGGSAGAVRTGSGIHDGAESGQGVGGVFTSGSADGEPPCRGLRGPPPEDSADAGAGDAPVSSADGRRELRPSVPSGSTRPRPEDGSALELDLELVERALTEFVREEVIRRRGFEKVVIGVSGGVDSAVSLFLAVRALGPENVFGFRLPYATSSRESLEHAALVLEVTGAHERTIDITGAVDAYVEEHEPDVSPLRRGNLAARLRSVTLFDQSARIDGLPLGTGNKSERLLGYFTWHADDSPPINPLGDLFKTQVWALARHLGVPEEIVEKPASADLVKGVHDEDELGISYPRADLILHWLLKGYAPEHLVQYGFAEQDVELVWRRLNATHWKRELPTVAVLSSSAIGEFYLRPVDY